VKDSFGREIDTLRISVTDRCNLRCAYCRPIGGTAAAPAGTAPGPAAPGPAA